MVIEFYNAHLSLQFGRVWRNSCEVSAERFADRSFFGRTDPFTTGIPASHSAVVITALSPALNNPPPWAPGRNSAAAAAATMSHYQLVNSLSDSLTAPFIFFPLSCSFKLMPAWPFLVSSFSPAAPGRKHLAVHFTLATRPPVRRWQNNFCVCFSQTSSRNTSIVIASFSRN